jgi:hypothetical protein
MGVPEVEEAIGLLEASGAVSASLERARALLGASRAGLASLLPTPEGLSGLLGLFDILDPPPVKSYT